MDADCSEQIARPDIKRKVDRYQPQSKLQAVILSAVVTNNVQGFQEAIAVYHEYRSLLSDDHSKGNIKYFWLLDFFPENTSLKVKVRKEYHSHSPLMIACENNNELIVEKLLENGASVALKNKFGLTAAHIVCKQGNLGIFSKILTTAKDQKVFCRMKGRPELPSDYEVVLKTRAKKGWYPVMYAVKEGNAELIRSDCIGDEYLTVTNKKKQTLLHISARGAHLNCLKEIMPRVTSDLKRATDKNGWNVMHHACASGSTEVLEWLTKNFEGEGVCTELLNQKSKCQYTPLLTACEYKKVDIVNFLLHLPNIDISIAMSDLSGTEATIKGHPRGRTALHIAAAHNSVDIVDILIKKECPLSVQDQNGDTALHYAYKSSSSDVINRLEHLKDASLLNQKNDHDEFPKDVKPKDVIPLEIKRRGKEAVEIYKRVLKKGKQKLPRCKLLILGEECVGKTSLYRLLVKKGFNPNQVSTRGIDDNEVDIVDERSVTMDWEEKPKENQEELISKTYVEGVSETLHEELPPEKKGKDSIEYETVFQENELKREIENIQRKLKSIVEEAVPEEGADEDKPLSQPRPIQVEHVKKLLPQRSEEHPIAVAKEPREQHTRPLHQPSTSYKKENEIKPKPPNLDRRDEDLSPSTASKKPTSVPTPPSPPVKSTTDQDEALNLSRQESRSISNHLRAKKKQPKNEPKAQPQLELKALDFAGQKQYRPMHHCFITSRAMYLVVFNLQKIIEYVEAEGSTTLPNPFEEIRYWLYSIHAHVFPPEEGDNLRRVCLVGTHRSPPKPDQGRPITDKEIKMINERLRREFSEDSRCINLFHYMGSKMIFAAVENSIDGKNEKYRRRSGAAHLQNELKVLSKKLKFLDEDHPLIWLRFEQRLIKLRQELSDQKLPLFVTVEYVKKLAESQGVDDDESCRLALNFFHDTGKIICLERVPQLYLNEKEQKELANLIILDPSWLSKVMRVVVELDPDEYDGDRKPATRLNREGIASKDLLLNLWKEFLPEATDSNKSFHHLCTILKAYCLIYPLNDSTISNSEEDDKDEQSSNTSSSNAESVLSEKPTTISDDKFLVPCILPKDVNGRKDDNHLPWVTFYFDFEKFLPEVVYHRFICRLLANYQETTSSRRTPPQFSKTWCRFNGIHECNWKIELLRDLHRLKISVLTPEDKNSLSQYIDYIHENYLKQICEKGEFRGLKYYGGPIANCKCEDSKKIVLDYVSAMDKESDHHDSDDHTTFDTLRISNKVVKCERCLVSQDVDNLLKMQKPSSVAGVQCSAVSSSTDADGVSAKPTLKVLMRELKCKAAEWADIGVELEFDGDELKKIKADNPNDTTDCLRELFTQWVKRVSPEPSWKAIIEAVEESLKDQELARKLKSKYIE